MENLTNYEEFIKEKLGWKGVALAGGMALTGALGGCYDKGVAKLDKIETIGNKTAKEYDLYAEGETFNIRIVDNFLVSVHSYTTTSGSGKHRHTTTHTFTNLIISGNPGKFIWYKSPFFGHTLASPNPFPESHLIKISDLKKYKETEFYTIYRMPGFFGGAFNYIIILKNTNKKMEGEEYKLSDGHGIGRYICHRVNRDIFIFTSNGIGEGQFGGSGAGSSF